MKIKISPKYIKQELKKKGYSFPELEEITSMNKNRWIYILNYGGFVSDAELMEIAGILQCDQNLFIDPEFQIRQNTPIEIDIFVRKLYERRKGNIQPVYEAIIKDFQKNGRIDRFIGETNRLLDIIFINDNLSVDLKPAISLIVDEFQKDRIFSGSHTELDEHTITSIFTILQNSIYKNSAQQAAAIFLYAIILFDVIFLEESIASVTQFAIERFGDKAEQYCQLTKKTEILRNTLINYIVIDDLEIPDSMIDEITEELLFGIQLMLLSCNKVGQHIEGDYLSSEYVNRAELDAIISRLTKIIKNIGIAVPDVFLGMSGTRFFQHICFIRSIFQTSKPKKFNFTQLDAYYLGLMSGRNGN